MKIHRALIAGALGLSAVTFVGAAVQHIKTPFETVPLWSDEMLEYLTGARQAPCSDDNAASVCLGRRRRLPIAIGDTVVRRIIGVDPLSARLQDDPEAVRVCR